MASAPPLPPSPPVTVIVSEVMPEGTVKFAVLPVYVNVWLTTDGPAACASGTAMTMVLRIATDVASVRKRQRRDDWMGYTKSSTKRWRRLSRHQMGRP